jgi:cell division protein FtsQ
VSDDDDREYQRGTPSGQLVTDLRRRRFRTRIRRWRPALILGALVVLAAVLGWLLYFSSLVTVRGVQVTGAATVSASEVRKVAQVPVGEQLVRVDLAAIEARVETIPAVRSVAVSRSWPHDITIAITERVPVAVLPGAQVVRTLDASGVVFGCYLKAGVPKADHGADCTHHRPPDLPKVVTAPDVNGETLHEAALVVQSLRSDVAARVDRIDAESVDKISLELTGGVTVQWGSAADSVNKARVLELLLRKSVTKIDVSVPGRPTTR